MGEDVMSLFKRLDLGWIKKLEAGDKGYSK